MVSFQCKNDALSADDRAAGAQRLKSAGMGLMVSAMGVFIGLSAGLSGSVGAGGAIGIGIGAASGLFIAGIVMIKKAGAMAAMTEDAAEEVQENEEEETATANV